MNWFKPQIIATLGTITLLVGIANLTTAVIPQATIAQTPIKNYPPDRDLIQQFENAAIRILEEYRSTGDKTQILHVIALCESILKSDPKHLEAYRNLGEALVLNHQVDDAIVAYRRLVELEIKPSDELHFKESRVYNYVADVLVEDQRFDEALSFRHQAIALTPDSFSYFNLADTEVAANRSVEALATYRQALMLEVKEAEGSNMIKDLEVTYTDLEAVAYQFLGNALLRYGKSDAAIIALRKAIAIEPEYRYAYAGLGRALSQQHHLHEAFTAYRKSLEVKAEQSDADLDAAAYLELGNGLSEQKQIAEAIAAYRQAIERNPQNIYGFYALSRLLIQQKQFAQAIPILRQALRLDPKIGGIYSDLGQALTEQQQWNEAIIVYQQWAKVEPNLILPYTHLGSLLTRQQRFEEALAAFRAFVKLAQPKIETVTDSSGNVVTNLSQVALPDESSVSQEATAYFYFGNQLVEDNQIERAISAYQTAVKLDAKYFHAYDGLGQVLLKRERVVEAIAAFKQALALEPENLEIREQINAAQRLP